MKPSRLYIVIIWFTGVFFAHMAVSPSLAQDSASSFPTIATNWLGEQKYHIGKKIHIELSGSEQEGLIAAGWIQNTSTGTYTIPNIPFWQYIHTDFQTLLQALNVMPYPVQNVTWRWEVYLTWHWEVHSQTWPPNQAIAPTNYTSPPTNHSSPAFAPFYCVADFDMAEDYNFGSTEANATHWKALVGKIVAPLESKWYIANAKGLTYWAAGGGGTPGLPAFDFSLVALGLSFSGLWLLRRRRLHKTKSGT